MTERSIKVVDELHGVAIANTPLRREHRPRSRCQQRCGKPLHTLTANRDAARRSTRRQHDESRVQSKRSQRRRLRSTAWLVIAPAIALKRIRKTSQTTTHASSAGMSQHIDTPAELKRLRQQIRTEEARQQLRRLQLESKLHEHYFGGTGSAWGDFVDPSDAFRDADSIGRIFPVGTRWDRQDGRNRPFIWNELDLDWTRAAARWYSAPRPALWRRARTLPRSGAFRRWRVRCRRARGFSMERKEQQ